MSSLQVETGSYSSLEAQCQCSGYLLLHNYPKTYSLKIATLSRHDFVSQEFRQDQLGDSSVTHCLNWGDSVIFSWPLGWSGESKMASHITGALVGWLEGWAQLGASL